ncbi:LIC_10190 family membrane protein [Butyrivibrio sp. NC2007]|uniref:LIC_10190 family membrane protein n=1 Tax=Butyrivibrio sp. NC2007 TaxID=1280683 RepID=UPI0003B5BE30|nr:hypothetical protein [Butyrivibrio sp. NC2007]
MLTVLVIWMYVIATTYLIGYGFLMSLVNMPGMLPGKKNKKHERESRRYDFKFRESYIITGIVLVTVYAQIVSLFTKVSLGANLVLLALSVLIAVYYREELSDDFLSMLGKLKAGANFYVYLAVFLIMAYGASHGYMHYDSDLYHAQAIRWIEEYGIVRGLGNLHVRLAYNSSAFPLSALYSFRFLGGQSYHVMSGFFALLLAWQCVDIKNFVRRGHPVISDFARLAAIYYLFTIYDEMMAPASDYFLSCLVFYIIIHWLDMNVRHERSYLPYILLALLGVFAITIKLSAAPMLLLTIVPIYKLFHNRTKQKMRAFWVSVALAFVIVLPFLIRNIILSGWLLYPVTFLDFFGFYWEIPKGLAAYDALEIRTFGRGYNDVATYASAPMSEWIPNWFASITGLDKIMLILALLSIIVYVIYLVYFVLAFAGEKTEKLKGLNDSKVFEISHRSMLSMADFLTIGGTLIGCFAFWFMSAPLIRYGIVYVWLLPAVILGRTFILAYNRLFEDEVKDTVVKAFVIVFLAWFIYKCAIVALEDNRHFNPEYLLRQQDYGSYEVDTFKLGDETFYYPVSGDQVGYDPFPSATHDITGEVELIGGEIKEGFKAVHQ